MRRPTESNHVTNCDVGVGLRVLRDRSHALRHCAPPPTGEFNPIQQDRPIVRSSNSLHQAQQRRFSRPVRAQQPDRLSRVRPERDTVDHERSASSPRDAAGFK
ncbi:hypothetical protein K8P10_002984 [Leucobacter sp. Psy1]|nr:hypothetical protein K8P10_002984 [Leucobacter sp. Psy1]